MAEIVVREITPRDRPASYGNVDLGVKENQSRGGAKATVQRDIPGTQFRVCLTFLADTFHNRAYILEKARTSKNPTEVFIRADDGKVSPLPYSWLDDVFGDIKDHAAKVAPVLPAGYSADEFDAPDHREDGTPDPDVITVALDAGMNPEAIKPKINPGPKRTAKAPIKPKAPAPSAMPEASSDEDGASISSLDDFLALSMKNQMLALEAGVPTELLQEITASSSTALEMDVKNEAFRRLTE